MITLKKASEYRLGVGCYQWWAKKTDAVYILKKLGLKESDLSSLESVSNDGEDIYCIYVGSAAKESIMSRLNWHINGKNGNSHISTLRRTIAAVFGYNLFDNEAISSKLSQFYVSWEEVDIAGLHDTVSIVKEVEEKEKNLINQYFRPLNIEYNKNTNATTSIPNLKKLRAETANHKNDKK